MKMKKHLLASALVVGLGVGAVSLPQGAVAAPNAQVLRLLAQWTPLVFDRLGFFERDSAGCYPWTLSVHCTGRPPSPSDRNRLPGDSV